MARNPALTPEEEVSRLLVSLGKIKRAADAEMRLLEARAAEFNRQIAEIEQRLASIMVAAKGAAAR